MIKRIMKVIKSNHIRAARALLDWNRDVLAEKSGLSAMTIAKLESGKTDTANASTYEALEKAFQNSNIVFTPNGVEERRTWVRELTGKNFYHAILEDIYTTLVDQKDAEVLFFDSDDRKNTPEVTRYIRKILNAGIKERNLIAHGNTYMLGPISNYRWLPAGKNNNFVKTIYADRVALDFHDHGLIIHNEEMANVERYYFDIIWGSSSELNVETTAEERY